MSRDPDIDRLVALRRLYPRRGPGDGEAGITPDGRLEVLPRLTPLEDVMNVANVLVGSPKDHQNLWASAKGYDVQAVPSWNDACPERSGGLVHSRTFRDPPGVCAHCGWKIGR